MRYLLTGGAGFIGSHLAEALLARGEEVVSLDDLSTGSTLNLEHLEGTPGFAFHRGTILDDELVATLAARADVVVHLAAAVGVKLIVERPLESLITNIRGTEVVLDAVTRAGCKVLVTSTSEIYGKNADGPLREDADRILGSPFKARWSYSTAKAVDEVLAHAYGRDRGLSVVVVRLFNCVGPRQTGAYGMVVPRLVRQALRGENLTVYGDGRQRRCFCHVTDVVGAVLALLDNPGAEGEVFNVGSQEEVTIDELAAMVIDMTGSSSTIIHIPYDEAYERGFEDMPRRLPDISKVTRLTGWRPSRTLHQTLANVIEHERQLLERHLAVPEASL